MHATAPPWVPVELHQTEMYAGVDNLPPSASAEDLDRDEFLQVFHHALLEVTLEEGSLVCPETGRKFSVQKGIPNLLLNEDEC